MSIRVYVAAASQDWDRAEHWMQRLRDAGVTVTSTWVETIRAAGAANPADASDFDREKWARDDFDQVAYSDLLWLLVPDDAPGRGAYAELGFAWGCAVPIVSSGATKQSVFTSLGKEYAVDGDAFDWICSISEDV